MKNALIYARVSTVDQKQKRNIDVQVKELQEYCHAEGLNIIHTYRDDGVSANAPDRLEKLTEYIVDHKDTIDCLVFRSMTRIARKMVKSILFREEMKELGVTLISLEDGIINGEGDDDETELILIIKEWYGQKELKKITKRMIRGRKDTALGQKGKKSQGQCPLGYAHTYLDPNDSKSKAVVVVEEEAELVKMIFRTFLDTGSTTKTAKAVNEAGYTTKRGKAFSRQGIQTILQNDFYTGIVQYSNEKKAGTHEAIISKHLFTKVQKLFKTPQQGE